jgi:hypothetical protein
MVVDAIYVIVASLARGSPGEYMYLMAFPRKSSSQFCHMDSNTPNSD